MSGLGGQAADIAIHAKEILRMREILNEILAEATNQTLERVSRDVDRDYIMEPDQAGRVRNDRSHHRQPRFATGHVVAERELGGGPPGPQPTPSSAIAFRRSDLLI
jgi:hypothetical protein